MKLLPALAAAAHMLGASVASDSTPPPAPFTFVPRRRRFINQHFRNGWPFKGKNRAQRQRLMFGFALMS